MLCRCLSMIAARFTSLRILWSAVIKSPKCSALGWTVPARLLQEALVIFVFKQISQFGSFEPGSTFAHDSIGNSWEECLDPQAQGFPVAHYVHRTKFSLKSCSHSSKSCDRFALYFFASSVLFWFSVSVGSCSGFPRSSSLVLPLLSGAGFWVYLLTSNTESCDEDDEAGVGDVEELVGEPGTTNGSPIGVDLNTLWIPDVKTNSPIRSHQSRQPANRRYNVHVVQECWHRYHRGWLRWMASVVFASHGSTPFVFQKLRVWLHGFCFSWGDVTVVVVESRVQGLRSRHGGRFPLDSALIACFFHSCNRFAVKTLLFGRIRRSRCCSSRRSGLAILCWTCWSSASGSSPEGTIPHAGGFSNTSIKPLHFGLACCILLFGCRKRHSRHSVVHGVVTPVTFRIAWWFPRRPSVLVLWILLTILRVRF